MANRYDLIPVHDTCGGFSNRFAWVEISGGWGQNLHLYSDGHHVASIGYGEDDELTAVVIEIFDELSYRHIAEFLKQNGFKAESWEQVEDDYLAD